MASEVAKHKYVQHDINLSDGITTEEIFATFVVTSKNMNQNSDS